jgi:hypothetical protein
MAQKYLRFSPMLLGSRYTMHLELLRTETHLPIFTLLLGTVHYQRRAYDGLDILTKLYYKPISSWVHSDIVVQITRQKRSLPNTIHINSNIIYQN